MFFKQCRMVQRAPNGNGLGVHTAWIPEQFAVIGRVLSLKFGECWSNDWEVERVDTRVSEEYVREHERDYKDQRKASDV